MSFITVKKFFEGFLLREGYVADVYVAGRTAILHGRPSTGTYCAVHLALNANMVDFHGFELPIWYSNIKEEHLATRSGAGLFDVSHMGSFRFVGDGVRSWLESLATQRITSIAPPRCAYTHFLDSDGCLIDDMIFAVVSEREILGVPNASMIDVMWSWFTQHLPQDGSVTMENISMIYFLLFGYVFCIWDQYFVKNCPFSTVSSFLVARFRFLVKFPS